MRHRVAHRKLGRVSEHRISMLRNQAGALLRHERISTTVAKAKELRPYVEKIITLGKKGDLQSRKKTISILQDKKNAKKVFDTLADRYKNRLGGYTRIVKLGNRYGDNAPCAIIEFIDRDEEAKGKDSGPVIEKKPSEEEDN